MSHVRSVVFYSGRVQGVGFRYSVKSIIPGYDVTGTIRNLSYGRVELVVEGEKQELLDFHQAIRDSGLRRQIRDEQVHWSEASGEFFGFEIIR